MADNILESNSRAQLESGKSRSWLESWFTIAKKFLFNILPLAVIGAAIWCQIQIGNGESLSNKFALALITLTELGLIFIWSLFQD